MSIVVQVKIDKVLFRTKIRKGVYMKKREEEERKIKIL